MGHHMIVGKHSSKRGGQSPIVEFGRPFVGVFSVLTDGDGVVDMHMHMHHPTYFLSDFPKTKRKRKTICR